MKRLVCFDLVRLKVRPTIAEHGILNSKVDKDTYTLSHITAMDIQSSNDRMEYPQC